VKTYHDIAGDGGSDVLGQVAARQRAVLDALAGVRRILAVGSGKGGVGKSTVTLALARAFRRRGLRVAILDADLNGPSQARMAGLESAPLVPVARSAYPPVASSEARPPDAPEDRALAGSGSARLALPRRPDGIGVVSLGGLLAAGRPLAFDTVSRGEQQTWRATRELALLLQLLSSVRWGELDLLLVDLPPGAERTVQYAELLAPLSRSGPAGKAEEAGDAGELRAALSRGGPAGKAEEAGEAGELRAPLSRGGPADAAGETAKTAERLAFVMVTVPSDVSRGVVARALAALAETPAALLGYVENMAGYLCRDCGEVRPLFPQPTVALDAPCLGRIPFDPALAELCDRGWPEGSVVEEDSAAFRQIEELAAEIQDRLKRPSSVSPGAGGDDGLKRPSSVSAGEGGRNDLKRPSSVRRPERGDRVEGSAGVGGGPNQEPLEEETR
jgi:Mrp family chromosome partitioning ATPase